MDTSGSDWLSAGDLTPAMAPGGGRLLGKRIPSNPNTGGVRLDAIYHAGGGNRAGRPELINRGTADVYDLDIELPENHEGFQLRAENDLPMTRLPAGKTHGLMAIRLAGGGRQPVNHLDLVLTGRTADGEPVSQGVFVSLSD